VLITLAQKIFALDFSFGCCTFSGWGGWGLFWPMNDNTGELVWFPMYDVISVFHSCAKQAQMERDSFFFAECLIRVWMY